MSNTAGRINRRRKLCIYYMINYYNSKYLLNIYILYIS